MACVPIVPVIVGVGDYKNRSHEIGDTIEPVQLMLNATLLALDDLDLDSSAREKLQSSIDDIGVVATWTWPYPDLPGLLAEKLDVKANRKTYSPHGGNQPIKLVDEAARRISRGESKVAVVTGGEALSSRE